MLEKEGATPPEVLDIIRGGKFLRFIRRSLDLSLREASAHTGIKRPILTQIEFGARNPNLPEILAFANAYNINPNNLLAAYEFPLSNNAFDRDFVELVQKGVEIEETIRRVSSSDRQQKSS